MRKTVLCGLAISAAALPAAPATAESWNSCAGFIESLPAVISTQGTWCLAGDLATGITTGNAIEIVVNNVTLDCNGFKVGGLAAGPASNTLGIRASNRLNVTVRHCNVRGFSSGVALHGADGGGHLVEDNQLDGNLVVGVSIGGAGNVVRRNRITDTGGSPNTNFAYAISLSGAGEIVDNTISVVTSGTTIPSGVVNGIRLSGDGPAFVHGNRIAGLVLSDAGSATGIAAQEVTGRVRIVGNQLFGSDVGRGIYCPGEDRGSVTGNYVVDFAESFPNCTLDSTANVYKP